MSGRKREYNIVLLGALGVGKSGIINYRYNKKVYKT